jgi:hypothetical protein
VRPQEFVPGCSLLPVRRGIIRARETSTNEVSRFANDERLPKASTQPVQPGHLCVPMPGRT